MSETLKNRNCPVIPRSLLTGLFRRKTSDEGADKQSFKCQYCSMTFNEKDRMKRHMKKAHSEKGGDLPNMNPFGGM